ncbi:MAG: hypothetical protein PHP05_09230, partial [Sideroxydans sp.]|nr:hypothetical protein [Sideroxydans sp.]
PRFRAAFDFMRLRAENGEIDEVLSDWWEEFSLADDNLRQDMVDQVRQEQLQRPKPGRAPRVPRKSTQPSGETAAADPRDLPVAAADVVHRPADAAVGDDVQAPKKRRRRRRNPNRGAADGGDGAPAQDPQA